MSGKPSYSMSMWLSKYFQYRYVYCSYLLCVYVLKAVTGEDIKTQKQSENISHRYRVVLGDTRKRVSLFISDFTSEKIISTTVMFGVVELP